MYRGLRGRGVVQKPRAKRRAESGGALRRDDSASRLAAHYRQRRKNGVVQTRQEVGTGHAYRLRKEVIAATQRVRNCVLFARNVRDCKIILAEKLRPPE